MFSSIPANVKRAWNKWNTRGVVLFSLFLQILLILICPFRRSTRHKLVTTVTWSAYLLADWAATFGIGLIFDRETRRPETEEKKSLLAFWAPFLLLHLGGPDTITAFSLEDNELWLRHFLVLLSQVGTALYVFAQSLPNDRLWIPTVLMFVAGIIKYGERTRALFLASLDRIRTSMLKEPDPGPNYPKFMQVYASKIGAGIPADVITIPKPDKEAGAAPADKENGARGITRDNLINLPYAYYFFKNLKGLLVDRLYSFVERSQICKIFNPIEAEDALQILEMELDFIYEVLHTKAEVVRSVAGYLFRFAAFGATATALTLFHFIDKHGFEKFDVDMTYGLFIGALSLEALAFVMLVLSDWTYAPTLSDPIPGPPKKSFRMMSEDCMKSFLEKSRILELKKLRWSGDNEELSTPFLFRRWSGSTPTHNLIGYSLRSSSNNRRFSTSEKVKNVVDVMDRVMRKMQMGSCLDFVYKIPKFLGSVPHKIVHHMGIEDFLDEIKYVRPRPLTKKLWIFIFDELKYKSNMVSTEPESTKPKIVAEISSARGNWILEKLTSQFQYRGFKFLNPYFSKFKYDQSLLVWHIATEICHNTDTNIKTDADYYKYSKQMSDYMLYLFVMRPTVMSAVIGIGKQRFQDTCAEAKRFFNGFHEKLGHGDACRKFLDVETSFEPFDVKGDVSKSVLFDACILAKKLNAMEDKELKWEVISKIWVEMLCHAAARCRASVHAQQLSKGGELITFVWLLMAHFGLGPQFQITELGIPSTKVVVRK